MKKLILTVSFLFISTFIFAQHDHHQHQSSDSSVKVVKAKSPKETAMAMVGSNHVHIDYSSPRVRGRNIWNGLVAYDQVWASGAHKATWIEFSEDVIINNQVVPKGKYGFFTIPNADEWTLILSKDWDMHLADDYKAENDILRIKVTPQKNEQLIENLTYQVTESKEGKGEIKLSWEMLSVSFEFENKK